jgi:hypothetical protein
MKRYILTALLILTLPLMVSSQGIGVTYEAITVADTAVGISAATLLTPEGDHVSACRGTLITAPVNIMYHGASPASTTGEPVQVGSRIEIIGYTNCVQFRAIRSTGTSGELRMTCER